jgi:hypothetical protein
MVTSPVVRYKGRFLRKWWQQWAVPSPQPLSASLWEGSRTQIFTSFIFLLQRCCLLSKKKESLPLFPSLFPGFLSLFKPKHLQRSSYNLPATNHEWEDWQYLTFVKTCNEKPVQKTSSQEFQLMLAWGHSCEGTDPPCHNGWPRQFNHFSPPVRTLTCGPRPTGIWNCPHEVGLSV